MLKMNHLKDIPLAIFANKVDIFEDGQSITEEDLANFMGINKKMSRVLNIFNTSAKTGVGIHKGIYWLADAIQESGKHTKLDLYQVKSLFGRPSTISGFA
ncbi:MAG: ADP-ribosylation factor-like protein, partial [Candidatus Hodarchaeales archaeon]